MLQPKIYYFLKDKEKEEEVRKLCRKLGSLSVKLDAKDLNRELSEIAGFSSGSVLGGVGTRSGKAFGTAAMKHPAAPVFYNMPELLVFGGMRSDALDVFLEEYKKAGIAPVELRAILTPFNSGWTIYELCEHLKKEAAQYRKE